MSKLKNLDDSGIQYGVYAKYIKRILDIIFSLLALIVLSPVFCVLCFLVRIKLGSPVFFKQTRAGRDEKSFDMIKFRTMTDARDENGDLLPDTARFTKFGDTLRKLSLDELPELFCVLKGDMSLVGPRPLYTYYLPFYTEEEALRHIVRGGITGLAQVNGRALCRWKDRFAYDVQYVSNITFFNDVKILFQTIFSVFKRSDIGIPSVTDEGGLHILREVQRIDKVKEIGSSFSDKSFSDQHVSYPVNIVGLKGSEQAVFLSTGRSCISEILKFISVKHKKAIIPSFTCDSVVEPFFEAGYEVFPYRINLDLTIDTESMKKLISSVNPSVILFHRYFGFDTCHEIRDVIKNTSYDAIIIEDETQYMFSEKRYHWADYRIGSIRKWGPIPDGAFLVSNGFVLNQPTEKDNEFISIETSAMTEKQAFIDGKTTNKHYMELFVQGREYIDKQKSTYSMSEVSSAAIAKAFSSQFLKSRKSNAAELINGLRGYNWLTPVFDCVPEEVTPFMVPVLVHKKRKELQQYLSSQKIYATVIWGCPERLKDKIGSTEKQIYNEILCIPCDQRYTTVDMVRICAAINHFSVKNGYSNE